MLLLSRQGLSQRLMLHCGRLHLRWPQHPPPQQQPRPGLSLYQACMYGMTAKACVMPHASFPHDERISLDPSEGSVTAQKDAYDLMGTTDS